MAFVVKFFVTAVVLAAAVWFGVPLAKPLLEGGRTPIVQTPTQPRVVEASPVTPAPSADATASRKTPAAPAESAGEEASVFVAESVPQPAVQPVAQPQPRPQVVVEEPISEPVQDPTYQGPRYDWGVLAEETQTYGVDGNIRVKLPAGTVIEKIEEKNSSSGRMYVCRILQNRRWQNGFVFAGSSAVMFAGPFAEAPKAASDKVIRYFQLDGLIEARTAALREAHLKKNPYFEQYRRAAKEYTDLKDKAKELTEKRDAAQGAERSRLSSELDRMRAHEGKLAAAVQKIEGPYKDWKKKNGDGQETIASDAQLSAWYDERFELRDEVAEMVPGI